MSKAQLNDTISELHGAYTKEGTVFRQKKIRSASGAVLHSYAQEAYHIANPRDFKKKPPKGAELANMNRFSEALRRTQELLEAGQLTPEQIASLPAAKRKKAEQLRSQLAEYQARFEAQLSGEPDPAASLLPKSSPDYNTHSARPQYRHYYTLYTFLRAVISNEIK